MVNYVFLSGIDRQSDKGGAMDRHLTLEAVRLTEMAALHASRFMGKGDEDITYLSAADVMVKGFDSMYARINIAIGADSGENKLNDGSAHGDPAGPDVEVAVKPLDGKMTCARGGHNAISVVAVGSPGSFMRTCSGYMEKIAVGPEAKGVVDIYQTPEINIKRIARAKDKYIEDITVCVLDRQVNHPLVEQIRSTGARIKYIRDGDISGAVSAAVMDNSIDVLMGVGGRKEGILAAAALKCLGGDMQARFIRNENKAENENDYYSPVDYDKVYTIGDLVSNGEIMISMTGVTDGVLLPGVRYFSGGAETTSIVMREKTHTLRHIKAVHQFDFKPIF